MTCFSGLLPEPHNMLILNMLFELVTWHAYAKLRIHTTDTLALFDTTTITLRKSIQDFIRTTCEHYMTYKLPQETAARGRRTAALAAKDGKSSAIVSLQ